MNGILDISTFIEHKNKYPKFIDLPLKEWKMIPCDKKSAKQDKLVK